MGFSLLLLSYNYLMKLLLIIIFMRIIIFGTHICLVYLNTHAMIQVCVEIQN